MFKQLVVLLVCVTFIFGNFQIADAQDFSINQLPVPGTMIDTTAAYVPLTLKGMVIHSENALKFDFLMDTGHSHLEGKGLSDEALKIMKYFLTALTIPEDDLWVNLSPYEKGRIIQDNFGQTVMGRDLLAQDYILKQLTASLVYPEKALGKEFWQQVYSKASQEYGTTQIPVNTFNRVWIVPAEAVVWEHENKVIIVKSHLKVMLEEDYLSMCKHGDVPFYSSMAKHSVGASDKAHALGSQIVRQIVLPVLEKEVNEGKNFAQLRQMYQAMILATWYKKALRESILNKVYADQKKMVGIGYANNGSTKQSNDIELIYQQYLKAFKKGAFNYIKEDKIPNSFDPVTGGQQTIARKYFSGGFSARDGVLTLRTKLQEWGTAQLTRVQAVDVKQALRKIGKTLLFAFSLYPQASDTAMNAIPMWKALGRTDKIAHYLDDTGNAILLNEAMNAIDAIDTPPVAKLPIYRQSLKNFSSTVQIWAIRGIVDIGDKSHRDLLIPMLDGGNENIREAVARAIDSLPLNGFERFSVYRKSIESKYPDVFTWTLKGLVQLGDESSVVVVLSQLNNKSPIIRDQVMQAVDTLLPNLKDKFSIFSEAVQSTHYNVRAWAIKGLSEIGTEEANTLLKAEQKDRDRVAMLMRRAEKTHDYNNYNKISDILHDVRDPRGNWWYRVYKQRDTYEWVPGVKQMQKGYYIEIPGYEEDYGTGYANPDWIDGHKEWRPDPNGKEEIEIEVGGYNKRIEHEATWEKLKRKDASMFGQTPVVSRITLGVAALVLAAGSHASLNRTIPAVPKKTPIVVVAPLPEQHVRDLGGITLNSKMLNMQTKGDGNALSLPTSQEPLDTMNLQGFTAQIDNVETVDLPELVGFSS